MEFKGKQRAEEYASEKSSSPVFKENHNKDYLSGYNQALEDSKTLEMLEMLQSIIQSFECDFVLDDEIVDNPYEWLVEDYKKAKQLIKQAT